MAAKAEEAERENANARGELVPLRDVIERVTAKNRMVVQHLMAIPSQCAVELASCDGPREVHALLTRLLREALDGLVEKLEEQRRADAQARSYKRN